MWIPSFTCPADVLKKVSEVRFSDKLRDYDPGMHHEADKLSWEKEHFRSLCFFFFFKLGQDYLYSCICRNLSVSLQPSSLCTQLPTAKPRHLSLRCTLLQLQSYESLLESYKEYLQLHQNSESCPNIWSYSPRANKNSSEGNLFFILKNVLWHSIYLTHFMVRFNLTLAIQLSPNF